MATSRMREWNRVGSIARPGRWPFNDGRPRVLTHVLMTCLALLGTCRLGADAQGAERIAWKSSRFAGTPEPPPPYRVEPVFPHLVFERPLDITQAPGLDRWFVAEQRGRIYSFPQDPGDLAPDLAIDFKDLHDDVTAVYAVTFHPDFARNRFAYVCYLRKDHQPDGTFISRFTVTDEDPPAFDPASERVIIRWLMGGHNGCCLKFGPDGYLYISTGDGAGPDPPDPLRAGQDVGNLLSAILRIDVDVADSDLPYRVPDDNPFVNLEGARPEIWAYGFRNPWRMSFDRKSGDLWVGDVGWQLWEMIYRVERGGNYGWGIMEGPQPVLPEEQRGPTPILPPVISHPHSEAASITGGFVYHGDRLPELQGAYIYGDYQTGKIWGLRHDGREITWHQELAQTPLQLVAFAEDPTGELLLLDYQNGVPQIHRLVPGRDDNRYVNFPRKLSETGLFLSVPDQTLSPGVIPYQINAPHWADHTISERWMGAPGTEPVRIGSQGNWQFPEGAVLAKTVSIEMEHGNSQTLRRLETQILHREEGSWRPYTYRWNDEQTDAELVTAAGASQILTIADPRAPGGMRQQHYRFASRTECQMCHNPWVEAKTTIFGLQSASPLGVTTLQLNHPNSPERFAAPNANAAETSSENQLTSLQRSGWLSGELPENLDESPRLTNPNDATADLNERVRSYLHVNCAHCHQRHAGGTATIDLAYETSLENANLVDVRPVQGTFGLADARIVAPGDPFASVLLYRVTKTGGGRMPRLGAGEVDADAVAMLHQWIVALPDKWGDETPKSHVPRKFVSTQVAELDANDESLRRWTSSTRGAWELAQMVERGLLSEPIRQRVIQHAVGHAQPEVRDLFERFVPPSERTERLGEVVNPDELLALPGDQERGRELFFRQGAGSCQSCHRVRGQGTLLGPDLSEIGKKYPPREMLAHLLEPSRFIEPKYVVYLLETVQGRIHTGLLVERNDEEVVLKNAQNEMIRVSAHDVELLVPQHKSLMPDLLLRDLTPQQAADLLAYLNSLK